MSTPRKRILVVKPGGYGAFRFDDTPLDEPSPGEVQVQVMACGINFADVAVRLGLYAAAKDSYPLCPGLEFSGVVSATGEGVRDLNPGDRVFGATRFGGYATVINCPSRHLWPLPPHWDFTRGAAFPVVYLTAYYALHQAGRLRKADFVLVHSAAGGVGTAILHLLKINGNRCVGVVGRTDKCTVAEAAGATHVIDKQTDDLWTKAGEFSPAGYDLILDANGASTLRASYRHLKPTGRLVVYGFASMFSKSGRINWPKLIWDYLRTPRFSPFDLTGANKTVSGFNLIYLFEHADLFREIAAAILRWDAKGVIPPMPISTFPFTEVVDAHRAIESGRTVGKLVLVV